MSATPSILNFSGGLLDPKFWGRVDLNKYGTALRTSNNGYPHLEGGWSNRQGMQFIADTKYSATRDCRVVPFEFSITQAYVIEFGHQYVRFYMNGGQIQTGSVTAYSGGTTYHQGDLASSGGVNYVYINTVAASGNSPPNATYWYALTGTIVEIPTPYVEADLPLVKWEQSADTLYLTHPSYPPATLIRLSHVNWIYTVLAFGSSLTPPTGLMASSSAGSNYSFYVSSVDSNGNESLPTNPGATCSWGGTLSWNAVTGAVSYNIYQNVNGIVGFAYNTSTLSQITASPPVISDNTKQPLIAGQAFNSPNNYPGTSAFYEGRLYYARTNNSPQQFWASRSGDYNNFNFSSFITAADSFTFSVIGGGKVNEIKRIMPMPLVAALGTGGGIWSLGQLGDQVLSATTPPTIKPVDMRWGINDMRPIYLGNRAVYFDNSSKRCRDLYYQVFAYNNQGNEISIWARSLWKDYFAQYWSFNPYPDSLFWIVRSDSNGVGLSYQREEGMTDFIAWWTFSTQGYFKDSTSINNPDGTQDVYFIVKRTINGATVRYVERLAQRYFSDIRSAWFVDAGVQYSVTKTITAISQANPCQITSAGHGLSNGDTVRIAGTLGMEQLFSQIITRNINGQSSTTYGPINRYYLVANATTDTFTLTDLGGMAINSTAYNVYVSGGTIYKCSSSFTGATQLANTAVTVVADGNIVSNITVAADGSFSIPEKRGIVTVGLPYYGEMQTMSPEYQTQKGTVQDKLRTIKSVYLTVQNTNGLTVGFGPEDKLVSPAWTQDGQWGDPTMSKDTFESAEVDMNPNVNPRDATVYCRTTPGLPATILRIIPRMQEGIK